MGSDISFCDMIDTGPRCDGGGGGGATLNWVSFHSLEARLLFPFIILSFSLVSLPSFSCHSATEDGLKIQFENYGKKGFSLLTWYSNLHSAIYLDYMSTICTCDDVETTVNSIEKLRQLKLERGVIKI